MRFRSLLERRRQQNMESDAVCALEKWLGLWRNESKCTPLAKEPKSSTHYSISQTRSRVSIDYMIHNTCSRLIADSIVLCRKKKYSIRLIAFVGVRVLCGLRNGRTSLLHSAIPCAKILQKFFVWVICTSCSLPCGIVPTWQLLPFANVDPTLWFHLLRAGN